MEIGQKIREIRIQREYSQEKMAQMLEISVFDYTSIEQGKTNVSIKKLEEITTILEISIFDILSVGEIDVSYTRE